MAGSNNLLQFNEEKNNMLNDGDYAASSQRKEGFVQGKASSILINKIMYQLTTFLYAFGEMMKDKEYVVSDANATTLQTVLANIITQADLDANYLNSSEVEDAIDAAVLGISVPVGSVHAMAGDTVPTGYLKCNGTAVSRTTYSNLFAQIGTTYGTGDGLTTFNLPDYRGMFLRGWNNSRSDSFKDPDAAGRSLGDAVGSTQLGENKSHRHSIKGYKYGVSMSNLGGNGMEISQVSWPGFDTTEYSEMAGGNESRPNNVYVMYVIKY